MSAPVPAAQNRLSIATRPSSGGRTPIASVAGSGTPGGLPAEGVGVGVGVDPPGAAVGVGVGVGVVCVNSANARWIDGNPATGWEPDVMVLLYIEGGQRGA